MENNETTTPSPTPVVWVLESTDEDNDRGWLSIWTSAEAALTATIKDLLAAPELFEARPDTTAEALTAAVEWDQGHREWYLELEPFTGWNCAYSATCTSLQGGAA